MNTHFPVRVQVPFATSGVKLNKTNCCSGIWKAIKKIFQTLSSCISCSCLRKRKIKSNQRGQQQQQVNSTAIHAIHGHRQPLLKTENPAVSREIPQPTTPAPTIQAVSLPSFPQNFVPCTRKELCSLIDLDHPSLKAEFNYLLSCMMKDNEIVKVNEILESFHTMFLEFHEKNRDVIEDKFLIIKRINEYIVKVELKACVAKGLTSTLFEDADYPLQIRPHGIFSLLKGYVLEKNPPEILGVGEFEIDPGFQAFKDNGAIFLIKNNLPPKMAELEIASTSPSGEAFIEIFVKENGAKKKMIYSSSGFSS